METIIERKTCKNCCADFTITQKDMEFYEKISPVFEWKKYQIPTPTLCPDCRQQRRLAFRNERNLYKRKCDATGKEIISMYSPDKKTKVYTEDFWWSDKWDSLDYGIDFDPKKSFFQQLQELFIAVPQPPLINHYTTHENSNYANYSGYLKNCYLVYECWNCENLFYGENSRHIENSLDMSISTRCQKCYFCFNVFDCYNLCYSTNSTNCSDSYYLQNCDDCKFCYNCENLSHRSYCIENREYSQEEYFEKIKKLPRGYDSDLYQHISSKLPRIYMHGMGNENVTGDYIFHSKDVSDSYHVKNLENGKYCSYLSSSSKRSSDCYDYDYFWWVQKIYESVTVGGISEQVYFSLNTWELAYQNMYCNMCHTSKNLFGCVWLKGKQYCILNKQYTKDEYERLVPQIMEHMKSRGEWWEFFPTSMSPFGYNETIAQQHFPLEKDQVLFQGHNWSDYEIPFPKVDKIIAAQKLPKDISDIPDDILNWAIECEVSKKPFRIIPQELEFYRKHGLPIPKLHPEERHKQRMKLRNPQKLYKRSCGNCRKSITTTYTPERVEEVFCEECFNKKIYG